MRRFMVGVLVGTLLVSALAAHSQSKISIAQARDENNVETLDLSLRDADVNEVLTALFATNDKYQLQTTGNITGRLMGRTQLSGVSFEKALNTILGTNFGYKKEVSPNGQITYTVSGRNTTSPATTPGGGPTTPFGGGGLAMAPPSTATPPAITTASASPFAGTATGGSTKPASPFSGLTASAASSSETPTYYALIINYLDLYALCDAFNGVVVPLYNTEQMSATGTTGLNSNGLTNNGLNSTGTSLNNNGLTTNTLGNTGTTRNLRSTRLSGTTTTVQ